ncbi:tRNA lysidine(34) synthetase TilS [Sphingomonas sp. LHG3443-2]|uniref:tRNA lysidine(34) synthetase TilS n=1 Tax=Sphingomonas sp. LHG3443-2 TaxID=2804639 RepID=UPI003CF1D1FF
MGVAVSGGPDSLALLLLAAKARPGRLRAATVDHGLRAESAGEAGLVAAYCAGLGVPHDILRVEVAAGASVQAQARAARYAALGEWAQQNGLAAVATAHHADDQAETLLMRLARGSGVGGLAGIREQRGLVDGVRLIRPLLGWRKADLVALVADAGWTAIDDPTNRDDRHDRTNVRRLLSETPWLQAERLARSAAALADAAEALEAIAARERTERVREVGDCLLYQPSQHREIRRRVAAALIRELSGGGEPRGPDLDRLLDRVEAGGSAALGGVMVRSEAQGWRFEPAPPRRSSTP